MPEVRFRSLDRGLADAAAADDEVEGHGLPAAFGLEPAGFGLWLRDMLDPEAVLNGRTVTEKDNNEVVT